MATFTVGPDGKLLMDGKPIENLWGSLGRNVTDVSTGDVGFYRSQPGAYDPQFYEQYDMGGSEGSSNVGYRLRPEVQQQLGGRIQIGQTGVGGAAEVIDPSKLVWDEQYGVLTEPSNIKAPQDSMLDRAIGPIVSALINPAVAMGSGSLFQPGGLLGGSNAFSGATAGGEISGTPGLSSAGGAAAGFTPPSTPLMLAPGSEAAAMMDSWLINNGMPWLAGGSLTGGLGMLAGDTITGAGLLGAGRAGLTAAGLLGTALGGGGSGSRSGGGGWSAGSGAGGGLNIQDANYVPNQHTARQLQELYGGNNMGTPSSGQMGGQIAPWQNNLYGGGQQGMPMTGGQQNYPAQQPMNMMGSMGGLSASGMGNPGGLLQSMQGQMGNFGRPDAQTYVNAPKPMQLGAVMSPEFSAGGPDRQIGNTFGTKPMNGGDFGPLPPPSSPPGDFGPLPPPGTPQLPGSLTGGMPPAMQAFYQQMGQRPQISDMNVDQSVRNSAIGDGYSGVRNGFLWAGGQRLMPQTGSAQQDQATLRQFGIRPPTFGSQYGFDGNASMPPPVNNGGKGPQPIWDQAIGRYVTPW